VKRGGRGQLKTRKRMKNCGFSNQEKIELKKKKGEGNKKEVKHTVLRRESEGQKKKKKKKQIGKHGKKEGGPSEETA